MNQEDPLKQAVAQKYLHQEEQQLIKMMEQKETEIASKYYNVQNNKGEVSLEEEMELNNARNGTIPEIVEKTDLPAVVENLEKKRKFEKLEQTRKDYAEMDFKKRNMWKKVRSFLPIAMTKEKRAEKKVNKLEKDKEVEKIRKQELEKKDEKWVEINREEKKRKIKIQKGREYDQDVAYMEAHYQNALLDYKTAWLEDVKNKSLEGKDLDKELGAMVKYFDADEFCELNKVRAEARANTTVEGSRIETVKSGFLKVANAYNKIPPKWRFAIGIAIAGGTLGAGAMAALPVGAAIGGAAVCTKIAAGFMALGIGKKFLVGLGVGSGAAMKTDAIAEGISNWNKNRKSEKLVGDFINDIKGDEEKMIGFSVGSKTRKGRILKTEAKERFSSEEKMQKCNALLNDQIESVDKKLQNSKLEALLRKSGAAFVGMGVGYLIGSGELFRWLSKTTGAGDFVKEKIGDAMKSDIVREFIQKYGLDRFTIINNLISHPQAGISKNPALHDWSKQPPSIFKDMAEGKIADTVPGTEKITESILEIKRGSSFEGTLIEHLNKHPDLISRYNELNGGRKFNVGQIAHRMALEFANDNPNVHGDGVSGLGLVHEGAKITVDPNTMEINEFEDQKGFGQLPEKVMKLEIGVDNGSYEKPGAASDIIEEPKTKMTPGMTPEETEKEFSDVDQSSRNKIIEEINDKDTETKKWEEQPASKFPIGMYEEHLKNLTGEQRRLWEELSKENTVFQTAKDIRKHISIENIENWRKIKDLTFDKIKDSGAGDKVTVAIKNYQEILKPLGTAGKSRSGETVAKWTERIARLVIRGKNE